MQEDPIQIEIRVEPSRLALSERSHFRITLLATNRGTQPVDPELRLVDLLVDGRRSEEWSLAVGNGRREDRWYSLPAGETVSMTWSSLGESLLAGPGDHTLVPRLHGKLGQPVRVHVTPE